MNIKAHILYAVFFFLGQEIAKIEKKKKRNVSRNVYILRFYFIFQTNLEIGTRL